MPVAHAKLSPSGSKLDLKCAGNRREQAKIERTRSEASDRGTGAHALAEMCLLRGQNTLEYINWWCGCNSNGADFVTKCHPGAAEVSMGVAAFKIDAKMAADVQMYVDEVRKIVASLPGAQLGVEIRSKINDHIWGTTDAAVQQYFGRLHIVDYKNGVTHVDEVWNSQMMLYAVGLIKDAQSQGVDYRDVVMTIVQPNTQAGSPVRSFGPVSPVELLKWFNETYWPAAQRCLDPNAQLTPGPWCKDGWCDARHQCPALMAQINQTAIGMFSPVAAERTTTLPAPIAMTPEQRRIVLDNRDLMIEWIARVYDYEYSLHQQGQGTWGKLVKGRNSRDWTAPGKAEHTLAAMLGNAIYTPGKLKTPAQIETELMGLGFKKKDANAKIKDLVSVNAGQPRLVANDAPGKEVNPVSDMFTSQK